MTNPLSQAIRDIRRICSESNGRSQCFEDGSNAYYDSTRHFLESSSEVAAIAVQPGHVDDLAEIMKVLAKYKVLFAIKAGGHATNPFFSSTMGVQIYMCRLNKVQYRRKTQTVDIGAGCVWDEVYGEMTKHRRNIVGGASAAGVGVAGYLLGGGYSLKTNQYGLGIDNVTAIQVIFPNGEVHDVHEGHHPELFTALKGGGNNFGIITGFTLKTHPQGKTWGASFSFDSRDEDSVKDAIIDFITQEKRPEAAMVAAFRHTLDHGKPKFNISLMCVLDGSKPLGSKDPWQRFASISQTAGGLKDDPAGWKRENKASNGHTQLVERDGYREIYTMAARNHAVLPDAIPKQGGGDEKSRWASLGTQDARGRFGCIMVKKYTRKLIDAVAKEAEKAAKDMKEHKGKLVLMDVWPFLPSIFDNSTPAAWPHKKGKAFGPLLAYFLWEGKAEDQFWLGRMQTALDSVREVAVREGCAAENAPTYSNNSLEYTPVEDIYRGELKGLSALRAKYDPTDVMGRAGGFKIPLPKSMESSSVTMKKFKVEGFYSYRDALAASGDNGFMEFSLEYDTSSSTIRASGRDNPGYFNIFGLFDGKELRFIKQYSSWEWKYIGTAAAQGEDVYQVAGAWGTGRVQHGSFAMTILGIGSGGARKLSSAVRLEGEWTGAYFYSTDPQRENPTTLYLAVKPGTQLQGAGEDGVGAFTLAGSHDGAAVTMRKTYIANGNRWEYSGVVDASGARLRGTWGDGRQSLGTFGLIKGRSIAYAQAREFMPDKNKLLGRGSTARVRDLLEKQGSSSSLANGFTELWS
ncbi:hypothetical protein B0H10DRAFT_2436007 [Mycena sp. CBHHK59/15]|nr:hypothetical protein B0H10DRAFT_2436007 [Mycena sp. CBHHK59/15]